MNEREYKNYMRRYADKWRVRRSEDGVYQIIGKYCIIIPDDYEPQHLLFVCEFPNKRIMTLRLKKISQILGEEPFITQQGDADCVFKMKNYDVNTTLCSLKQVLGIYVRKYYPKRKLSGVALKQATGETDGE